MVWPSSRVRSTPRALLALGRLPHLPTVWSNCLAGWVLGGGGSVAQWLWLVAGASFVHFGGAYLNDYFDADFDQQHRKERPIPAGQVNPSLVARLGVLWLGIGLAILWVPADAHPVAILLFIATVVVYDWLHQVTKLSPVLIGFCRFLLYLIAGSASDGGITGLLVWSGLAMASYTAGVGSLARQEPTRGPVHAGPLVLLFVPILLAFAANAAEFFQVALGLSFLLAVWMLACLRHTLRELDPNIRLTTSGLIAGIVLVDLLAVGGHSLGVGFLFVFFFLAAVGGHRYQPN